MRFPRVPHRLKKRVLNPGMPKWREAAELYGSFAVLSLLLCLLLLLLVCTLCHTNTTRTERITSLKMELVEEELRKKMDKEEDELEQSGAWSRPRTADFGASGGFAAVIPHHKGWVEKKRVHVGHTEEDYVDFDIRHILIYFSALYEVLQLFWIVAAATSGSDGSWHLPRDSQWLAVALMDFGGTSAPLASFGQREYFKVLAALYFSLPGLWLCINILFLVFTGCVACFAVFGGVAKVQHFSKWAASQYWNGMRWLQSFIHFYQTELAVVFLDSFMLVPVVRACFAMLHCRYEVQVRPIDGGFEPSQWNSTDSLDRLMIFQPTSRLVNLDGEVFLTEAGHDRVMACWRLPHVVWASSAICFCSLFVGVGTWYTVRWKGDASGSAKNFSSRVETWRVLLVSGLVAVTTLFSGDEGLQWLLAAACSLTFLLLLLINIRWQPALGRRGKALNSFRSAAYAALFWCSSSAFAMLSIAKRAPIVGGWRLVFPRHELQLIINVGFVPFVVTMVLFSV